MGWFVPGAQKVELDEGWVGAQQGDVVALQGAWLVHPTRPATNNDERRILLAVSEVLPPGAGCAEEHLVSLELVLVEEKDDPPRLEDLVFEVTSVQDGRVLVAADETLARGEPTVSAAPYLEGELVVPSNRWTVDPACTVPVRGELSVSWALDASERSGGTRRCDEGILTEDQLRSDG